MMSESLRKQISSPGALFVFEAVARHGGFRSAALELNVTQPSVSYQIKNLEKHLGTLLFDRRGRSVALTQDGETLFKAVERGFASIQIGLAEISRRSDDSLVTFCISSSAAANFVLPRYPTLREVLPSLNLSIKIINRDFNPAVENGDFSLRLGHGDWDDLDAWHLFDEVYFPVSAPGYFDGVEGPITLDHNKAAELLFLKERNRARDDWQTFFERTGSSLSPTHKHITLDDQQVLLGSVADGQGVGLGWLGMVDHLLSTGSLVRPVDTYFRTGRAFYLVSPKGIRETKTARAFRQWLLSEGAAIQKRWDEDLLLVEATTHE
jgi:DNA-binding transcriptional LysR family regulator